MLSEHQTGFQASWNSRANRSAPAERGSVAAVPWRAHGVEAALVGQELDDERVSAAAQLVDRDIEPLDDLHASAAYRRRVTRGLTQRAVHEAVARAAGRH